MKTWARMLLLALALSSCEPYPPGYYNGYPGSGYSGPPSYYGSGSDGKYADPLSRFAHARDSWTLCRAKQFHGFSMIFLATIWRRMAFLGL
jgi:hypothetical protein